MEVGYRDVNSFSSHRCEKWAHWSPFRVLVSHIGRLRVSLGCLPSCPMVMAGQYDLHGGKGYFAQKMECLRVLLPNKIKILV